MKLTSARFWPYITRLQYFSYFGVMGMVLPYFNLYCYHLGFSGFQIGFLSAVRSVAMVLSPLAWGVLADRFQIRRPIYITCNFISVAIWALYFYTTDFVPMLLITLVYTVFYSPIISFLEAFTMDVLAARKTTYGQTRAWGSVSFIVIVILMGRAIDAYSTGIILIMVLFGSAFQAVIATAMPRLKTTPVPQMAARVRGLLNRRVLVFLGCAFLMLVSHGAYYGFFSIHLETLGVDKTFIGIAWALASSAEIGVMITSRRIFKRFSLERVLTLSFFIATLRWAIVYLSVSPTVILLSQLLHAITYGAFHMASIIYMDQLMPPEIKTLGQAANNATTYGLGLMVGFFLSGYLYQQTGSAVLFGISAAVSLSGGLLFAVFGWRGHRQAP